MPLIRGIKTNNPKHKKWWKDILKDGGENTEVPCPKPMVRICFKCLDHNETLLEEVGECKFYYLGRVCAFASRQDKDGEDWINGYVAYDENFIIDAMTYRRLPFTDPYDHDAPNSLQTSRYPTASTNYQFG